MLLELKYSSTDGRHPSSPAVYCHSRPNDLDNPKGPSTLPEAIYRGHQSPSAVVVALPLMRAACAKRRVSGICPPSSAIQSCDFDCKRIGERHFLKIIEATRGARVTGVKVGTKSNQLIVCA
jgi:hypothetical protein